MTEKDIMVGDWFLFRYTTIGTREVVHTFRISQIENQLGQYYVWGDGFGRMCHPENLEQIQITHELLEKNGFKYIASGQYGAKYILATDYYDIAIAEISDSLWQVEYECVEMGGLPSCRNNISYVHELQHFLKLCGTQEDITL